jgi:hypothetical protein
MDSGEFGLECGEDEFALQMTIARAIMERRRQALQQLAESPSSGADEDSPSAG